MKIESIDIKNFKILKNSSIQLGDFTLLSGLNSSGKSSIIQALLLLKQNQINFTRLCDSKSSLTLYCDSHWLFLEKY